MRRALIPAFLLLLISILVGAGGTGIASAASVQTITPYMCPTSTGGFNGSGNAVVTAQESGGDPVVLKFGWGALQTKQLDKFLQVEDGSVTLTDPSGNVVFSERWDPTNTSGWSAYVPTQLFTPSGQGPYSGYGTRRFEQFGYLSNPTPGTDATYYLNMTWNLEKGVTDGFGAYSPGPILTITNCPITVRNYNTP